MKDHSGGVIGLEKLNFSVSESDSLHVALETAPPTCMRFVNLRVEGRR